MRTRWLVALPALLAPALLLVLSTGAEAGRRRSHENVGNRLYASPQSQPVVLSDDGSRLYVASTTSNQVDVIDASSNAWLDSVKVGMEPVGLAISPDGHELWVANHVSDSVSVVDIDPNSASHLEVVETVQELDANDVSLFDEPVGVAFAGAGTDKAYVTLSSLNDVAVVDTSTYEVTGRLHITAQDPRALTVRDGLLYVAAFESGNETEVSACEDLSDDDDPPCTLDSDDLATFAQDPNLPGETKNIQVDGDVPDRDLFVYDTADDTLVQAVEGVGTLLYGLTVSSTGEVFVAQTDARNAVNGAHGQFLDALENRMFLNQVTQVSCSSTGCGAPSRIELEPLPPSDPAEGDALATPYGIEISGDDAVLVGTAAASSRLFTLDPGTGSVLGRLDVGAIPRGLALRSDATTGEAQTAYVLNTLGNSVSVVDVSDPTAPSEVTRIGVGDDPTPEEVRLGRIAFNNARASDSRTFACASCHPDGNTDQLLWRIGGECVDCDDGHEPRTTMPIRGLRDTVPLHWDGTLGDPFGGPNGTDETANFEPTCDVSNPRTCFRDLVDATQVGPMCDQSDGCADGGELSDAERDDMAAFLEVVAYPPARSRRPDDSLSSGALTGFEEFFTDVGGSVSDPDTCADSDAGCHELPLGTATNSETLSAFEAPTMRGMTDRFLQFSLGITNTEEMLLASNDGITFTFNGFPVTGPANDFPWDPAMGMEETSTFGVAFTLFDPVYNASAAGIFPMLEEASTGHSGAIGRQLTLNTRTVDLAQTTETLDTLEAADQRGVVNFRGNALRNGNSIRISYKQGGDVYQVGGDTLTRSEMLDEVRAGSLLATLTGHLRGLTSVGTPQPLVAPPGAQCGTGDGTTGDPALPVLSGSTTMSLEARHVTESARVFVDGQKLDSASVTVVGGDPVCSASDGVITDVPIEVDLGTLPSTGLHVLQVQEDREILSPEMPFVVE